MVRFRWELAFLLLGCTGSEPGPPPGRSAHLFAQFDQNVFHDTLLVQTSFDLGDGTFVMVASHVEDTFEGLRLYRYAFAPDSSVDVRAISAPGYDSWTLLPTFFPVDSAQVHGPLWVLANMGEKESWGQKVMVLDSGFRDIGFMDMAYPERVMEDDTLRLKRRSIAPYLRLQQQGDTAFWGMACDSVYLYDDLQGHQDVVLAAHRVRYFTTREGRTALEIDGQLIPYPPLP